jgi:hypothetical protein
MSEIPRGGMWPTASDLTLLRALIAPREATDPMWDQLRAIYPSAADIVAQQPRLAALFHYRLRQAGVDWPDAAALAETARRVWGSNQMRLFRATEIHNALERAGIDSMFLKGVALLRFYPAETTRPMHDIDALVHDSDFDDAADVLSRHGWSVQFPNTEVTRRFDHAGLLVSQDGEELDLHWRLGPGVVSDTAAGGPWESSRTIELAGRSMRVLGPTYQLYHVIGHGLAWAKAPSLQWIPDAVFIIDSARDEIDWEQLLSLADRDHRGVAIREGLRLLSKGLGAAVPDWVPELTATHSGPERREAWFLRHVGPKSLVGAIPDRWYLYRRVASSIGQAPTPWGYWRYLRWRWAPHGSFFATARAKVVERIRVARGQM